MTDRRTFLKAGTAILTRAPSVATLEQARLLVQDGRLGRVAFCRIAHEELLTAAQHVVGQTQGCVIAVEPGADGLTFLGSGATLSVCGDWWRVFESEKQNVNS